MKKEIGVSRIVDFRRCRFAFAENAKKGKRPVTQYDAIGRAAHKLAAGGDEQRTLAAVERQLSELPEAEREAAVRRALELSRNAAEMQDKNVRPDDQEVQLSWHDPVTGWTVYSKPDERFYFQDARDLKVLQLTDLKSGYRVTERHKDELFLHGLIASLSLNYRYSIRLVIRLLGAKTEVPFWYSQRETYREVDRLRHTLRQIEAAAESGQYDPNPSFLNCHRCKLLSACTTGQAYLAARDQVRGGNVRELPVVAPVHEVFATNVAS